MSALTARLASIEAKKNNEVMYSVEGAQFQEYAISILDFKGSAAHKMIGSLVTAINNKQISVSEATARYQAALSN